MEENSEKMQNKSIENAKNKSLRKEKLRKFQIFFSFLIQKKIEKNVKKKFQKDFE